MIMYILCVTSMQDFGEDCSSAEDGACETETEDESEATSDGSDDEVDVPATAEAALKKIVPFDFEDFAKVMSVDKHDHEKHVIY